MTDFAQRWTRPLALTANDDPAVDAAPDPAATPRAKAGGASGSRAARRSKAREASASTAVQSIEARTTVGSPQRRGSSGGRSSLERLRPELDALRPSEVLRPNLDIVAAAGIVLAALPRIEALLPEPQRLITADCPEVQGDIDPQLRGRKRIGARSLHERMTSRFARARSRV
jgi:hypothetical protein